jgi:hypothetical protein
MADRSLADRTMIAVGRNAISVPRLVKRLLEAGVATGLTALAALIVILVNSLLTARGGYMQGLVTWTAFIRRSDILATICLTAIVTISYMLWQNRQDRR